MRFFCRAANCARIEAAVAHTNSIRTQLHEKSALSFKRAKYLLYCTGARPQSHYIARIVFKKQHRTVKAVKNKHSAAKAGTAWSAMPASYCFTVFNAAFPYFVICVIPSAGKADKRVFEFPSFFILAAVVDENGVFPYQLDFVPADYNIVAPAEQPEQL